MSTIRFSIKLSNSLTIKDGNMTSWYIWKHDVKCNFDIVVLHIFFLVFKFDKNPRNTKDECHDQIKNGMVLNVGHL
jgi:hypothetical protein